MFRSPASHRLLFALTLALPAAFAAGWAWLVPGGVVADAEAAERREAENALATAAAALQDELHRAATTASLVLQLDAERRVVGPFAAATTPSAAALATIPLAEQAAGSRVAAGDVAAALPFFAHAETVGTLSAEGALHYATLLAGRDEVAARAVLERALQRHANAPCAGVPFALLAILATADWQLRTGADPDDLLARALALVAQATAGAVPAVLDALAAQFPAAGPEPLAALRAAAAVAERHRDEPVPTTVSATAATPGPGASVLVPLADDRLVALPADAAAAARERAFAAAARAHPSVRLHALAERAPAGAATRHVPAVAATWAAAPAATPISALLRLAGHTSLWLAGLTLVAGNLLLWRLSRRELALVRLRRDFVDVVSHELRTPLTALSLKAEMLAAGDVPAERVPHYLQAVHGDVRRLADQVERILDFGRLERGAPIRREMLPVRTVLARGLRAGLPALRLVGQQLTVEAERALPTIRGDADVLARALRNLLENAAKYAPAGSTVTVRAFADAGEVVIEVADRGPGVPAAERSRIFQPFVRGATAPGHTDGSGIGLAIVAAAAEVHDGHVAVHARDGGGAAFTLRLPIARGEAS